MWPELQRINQRAADQRIPMNATFELTPRCNLHCKTCYIHRPELMGSCVTLKPMEFWLDMARQAKEAGTLVLVITGGETFLYPRAEELLEQLMGMGFIISLNTNGTLLDERRLAWLDEHRPAKINISLYGASNETYERLCGLSDGFTRVSGAIDALLERGINVYINGTLNPENVADIPAMVEFCQKRGLVLHATSYLFPPGRYGCHTLEGRLTPKEAADAQLLLERLQNGEEYFLQNSIHRMKLVEATVKGEISPRGGFHMGGGCSGSGCGGGRNAYAITHDGMMTMCVTNAGIAIPLDGKKLTDVWSSLCEEVSGLRVPGACEKCPLQMLCNACPAMLFNECGGFDRLSDYTCRYMWENYLARMDMVRNHLEKTNGTI